MKTLVGHQSAIYALASDGKGGFFSAGGDGMLVHWSAGEENGVQMAQIPDNVYSLAYNSQRDLLIAGSRNGDLYVLENMAEGNKKARRIEAHSKGIFGLAFFSSGFVSTGGDGNCRVWSYGAELLHQFKNSKESTRCVMLSKVGQWWLGSSDCFLRVYDENFRLTNQWQAHGQSVFAMAELPNQTIVSAGRDARIRNWSAAGEMLKDIPAHLLHVHGLMVSPDRKWVGSASMDKSIRLWDANSLELLKVLDAGKLPMHSSSVNALLWLDDYTLVSAGDDRQICIFRVEY